MSGIKITGLIGDVDSDKTASSDDEPQKSGNFFSVVKSMIDRKQAKI